MKRVFKNNRLIMIAFFTVFSIGTASVALANGNHPVIPVELKLVGSFRNQPLLQLNFTGNAEENEFIINVRDDAGNSLYRENIKGEIFSKKFLVNTDEIGDDTIFFEITSRKTNQTVVFVVNNNRHLTEETVISKMK